MLANLKTMVQDARHDMNNMHGVNNLGNLVASAKFGVWLPDTYHGGDKNMAHAGLLLYHPNINSLD